ncbi:MAG: hypothetical protein Q8S92_16985 [Hydrogenophaga sp.]|uniref:AbiTii domain-containing protein n=1 Tax=Hydrogenophaga sp. TaxID=1904254 RepID=UPI00273247A3|nr:hypothetical protein [Hydrogenophaga sp.]MDP3350689.1 hypothetical protein [Hydrogenophaga sp.]
MPALVPELVNMASDPTVSTGDLLRRALVVARRLGVPELVEWVTSELEGYGERPVPAYRSVRGRPQVFNPYRGYQPLIFPSGEWGEALSKANVGQSIPELEQLAQSKTGIQMTYSASIEHTLRESMNIPLTPSLGLSTVQIHGIVETVRSQILKWALDLEGRGVLGEGMTFTQQEKLAVQEQHYYFGNVSGSQIQISSSGSTQTQANGGGTPIEALKELIQALGVAFEGARGDEADELRAELATLKAQAESPKPKWDIIKATARSIKTVAEGASGGLLAGLAQPHLAILVALAAA